MNGAARWDTTPYQRLTEERGAKEMCHTTKRTHRFLEDFLMEVAVNTWVVAETCERNRWVRFGKRTHR
jgi:Mn-dependent DtxR family transcriptional regulator